MTRFGLLWLRAFATLSVCLDQFKILSLPGTQPFDYAVYGFAFIGVMLAIWYNPSQGNKHGN